MSISGLTPEEATRVLVAGYFTHKLRKRQVIAHRVAWLQLALLVLSLGITIGGWAFNPLTIVLNAWLTLNTVVACIVRWCYISTDVARYGYEWAFFCLSKESYMGWDKPHGGYRYVDPRSDREWRVRSKFRREFGTGLGLPGCEPIDDPAWYALRDLDKEI